MTTLRFPRFSATLVLVNAAALFVAACSGDDGADADGDGDAAGGAVVGAGGGTGGETLTTGGTGGMGSGGDAVATGGDMSTGGTGGDACGSTSAGGSGGAPGDPLALPDVLSETGLFEADMVTLGPGVRPFRPRFALWTDGAAKRRWISLPECEQIDTSNMDFWELPRGTKLWKEFSRDDKRVETRLLERKPSGIWVMVAYQWRDDLSDADKVPLGVQNASGTDHDIPSEDQCWGCHNQVSSRVLGFSAIQLAHDAGVDVPGTAAEDEWTLSGLQAAGLLTEAPPAELPLPGSEVEQTALAYLHVNCGHCHNPNSSVQARVDMELWLSVAGVLTGDVTQTTTYQTAVEVPASLAADGPPGGTHRVTGDITDVNDPDELNKSLIYSRFNSVGEDYSMPPLGTEIIDPAGETAIREWIEYLSTAPN